MKDLARIYIKAGDGGAGVVSFRRERGAPKGGPDGGDGGKGADVILVADENIESLVEFNYTKQFVGEDGGRGQGKKMHGRDSQNLVVPVPVGTEVYEIPVAYAEASLRERSTFEAMMRERALLVDMKQHGQQFVIGYGGKGGLGNDHFKSSTNQTPMQSQPGEDGEERWLLLELKVVAQVGIVGLPNVGKSSLLKALTRANPKIAGYPFTTLEPNLGVMSVGDKKMTLVDVPGVVEEAWEGKGIGPWFLRHLERCKLLLHVLAPDPARGDDYATQIIGDYQIVRGEFEKYGRRLPEKKEVVVVNKMELVEEKDREKIGKQFEYETGKELVWVSAGMGEVGDLTVILSIREAP